MIKAVLFDLDNTLIDFYRAKNMGAEAAISAMVDSGLELNEIKAKKIIDDLWEEYGIESQKIFQRFLQKISGKVDYRVLSNAITAYRRVQVGFMEPYPHVRSTLVRLKEQGIRTGIVSDAPRLKAWLRLSEMRMTEFFEVVVAMEDTGKLKPHELPFKAALKVLGMKPEEVLFVGDNPQRDIKGAKAIGMKTAWAKYGEAFKSKGIKPDFVLMDIQDLLKIVKR